MAYTVTARNNTYLAIVDLQQQIAAGKIPHVGYLLGEDGKKTPLACVPELTSALTEGYKLADERRQAMNAKKAAIAPEKAAKPLTLIENIFYGGVLVLIILMVFRLFFPASMIESAGESARDCVARQSTGPTVTRADIERIYAACK
jgi:hypothetical protein